MQNYYPNFLGSTEEKISDSFPKIKIKLSLSDKILFLFTAKASLNRCLFLTYNDSENKYLNMLLRKLMIIINNSQRRSDKALNSIIIQSFNLLIIRYLSINKFSEAFELVIKMGSFPEFLADVNNTKIYLLKALIEISNDPKVLSKGLSLIIQHPIKNTPLANPIIFKAIDKIYSIPEGKECCRNVIDKAGYEFKQTEIAKLILNVCSCPVFFNDNKIAKAWGSKISTDGLGFSNALQRDALIILSRVAEYEGHIENMCIYITQAQRLYPNDSEVAYWVGRAFLYNLKYEKTSSYKDTSSPRNIRLTQYFSLLINPSFNTIDKLISVFQDITIEFSEKQLLKLVLKSILEPKLNKSAEEIRTIAKYSAIIREFDNNCGWATINIILKLLIIDLNYHEANKEINKRECADEDLTLVLNHVISFFFDESLRSIKPFPPFDLIIKAKNLILSNQNVFIQENFKIKQKLISLLDDEIVKHIPCMKVSIELIIDLFSILNGEKSEKTELINFIIIDNVAPSWLKYFLMRVLLLKESQNQELLLYNHYANKSDNYFIISINLWLLNYSFPLIFNKYKKEIIKSNYGGASNLFALYGWNSTLDYYEHNLNKLPDYKDIINSIKTNLSKTAAAIYNIDIDISYKLYIVRNNIANGFLQKAKTDLEKLQNDINASWVIVKIWWTPIVVYWLSVIHAHLGDDNQAISGFESLLNGPKRIEAIGQLSLFLIKNSKLNEAEIILNSVNSTIPSICYAKALLALRNKEHKKAEQILQDYFSVFGKTPFHYYRACLRLLALIEESRNSNENAVKILFPLISENLNEDVIAKQRILRILTQQTYSEYSNSNMNSDLLSIRKDILTVVLKNFPKSKREYQCKLLFELLSISGDAKENIKSIGEELSMNFAVRQIYLRQLLKLKGTDLILDMLKRNGNEKITKCDVPIYYLKSIYYLESWNFLIQLWKTFLPGVDCSKVADHQKKYVDTIIKGKRFESKSRYVEALINAAQFAEAFLGMNSLKAEMTNQPNSFFLTLIIKIHLLLSVKTSPEKLLLANDIADYCREYHIALTEKQLNTALALSNWYSNDKNNFINQVQKLNYDFTIPIKDENLWLAQAFIWFNEEQYSNIFEKEMPDKIADLSNQDACLLMAKASSRLALKAWKNNNTKEAMTYVKQASSTISSLNYNDTSI